jgi:hypothetical protein
MPQIQLDDELLKVAQRRAADAGYATVDQYIADLVVHDLLSMQRTHGEVFFDDNRPAIGFQWWKGIGRITMQQVQLNDELYKKAEQRARAAGFGSVDDFVAERLESEFSEDQEDFDDRITPEFVAHLDRISNEMKAGKSVSMDEVDQHLADVRDTWLKDHAS